MMSVPIEEFISYENYEANMFFHGLILVINNKFQIGIAPRYTTCHIIWIGNTALGNFKVWNWNMKWSEGVVFLFSGCHLGYFHVP